MPTYDFAKFPVIGAPCGSAVEPASKGLVIVMDQLKTIYTMLHSKIHVHIPFTPVFAKLADSAIVNTKVLQ